MGQIKVKVSINRIVYDSPTYKIYSGYEVYSQDMEDDIGVLKCHPKYGTVSLVTTIFELLVGSDYNLILEEEWNDKYNQFQYKIINLNNTKPKTEKEVKDFLSTILVESQVNELMREYPNIIDLCMEDKLDEVDLSKLYGIGKYRLNVINEKVQANYALMDIVAEFKDYDLSMHTIKHLKDTYGEINSIKRNFYKDPYGILTDVDRIGFKTADKKVLKADKNMIISDSRCKSAIVYLLEQNQNNGHTYMDIDDLHSELNDLVPEAIQHFEECINDIKFSLISDRIALSKTYESELKVSNYIKDILNSEPIVWEYDVDSINEGKEFEYTDEQLNAIKMVLGNNIGILTAIAGTGKSFLTKAIADISNELGYSTMFLSPTGKASYTLSNYIGEQAMTIHRGLGFNPSKGWAYGENKKDEFIQTLPYDLIIVDEFSMIDIFLMRQLLSAINPRKTKILFVGDDGQLASVSCGNCANNMVESKIIPVSRLTKVFRYTDGGLAKVAMNVYNGNKYFDKLESKITSFGLNKDYILIKTKQEEQTKSILSVYKQLIEKEIPYTDIIVTMAMNKNEHGSININKAIQNYLSSCTNVLGEDYIEVNGNKYHEGDIIMQLSNVYEIETINNQEVPVFNGLIGKIVKIEDNNAMLQLGKELYWYDKDMLKYVTLAYSVNTYKLQGSQCPYVIVSTPKAHTFQLTRELLYTAITRTQKKCYHITDEPIIGYALKKSDKTQRNTMLKNLLRSA